MAKPPFPPKPASGKKPPVGSPGKKVPFQKFKDGGMAHKKGKC